MKLTIIEIITIIISLSALLISILSLFVQSKELKAQTKANELSTHALLDQAELQAISQRLETEIYLHQWNNQQVEKFKNNIEIQEEKKGYAKDNYRNIQKIRKELDEKLLEVKNKTFKSNIRQLKSKSRSYS